MDERFERYLEAVGMVAAFRGRVSDVLDFYAAACPEEIGDIFVSDHVNEEGSRVYTSLWLFSKSYCMEAKQFLHRDQFDLAPLAGLVDQWEVKKKDYDFRECSERSRLRVYFSTTTAITGEFQASGNNCAYLREILVKYVFSAVYKA